MHVICFVILILISGVANSEEPFGFVYSWGHVHAYNSFNKTYTRTLCDVQNTYSTKIELKQSELRSIEKRFDKSDFWFLPPDYLVHFGSDEDIVVISPCAEKRFFSQKGVKINYVWASCGKLPKGSREFGPQILEIGSKIEKSIKKSKSFKKAPNSRCVFY